MSWEVGPAGLSTTRTPWGSSTSRTTTLSAPRAGAGPRRAAAPPARWRPGPRRIGIAAPACGATGSVAPAPGARTPRPAAAPPASSPAGSRPRGFPRGCAPSATETLNRFRMRVSRLRRAWRLSLRDLAPGKCSSSVSSPMTMALASGGEEDRRARAERKTSSPLRPPLSLSLPGLLQGLLHLLGGEELDHVPRLDVVVVGYPDAALEAGLHLGRVVLESLQGGDLPGVDDDVVAQRADRRIAVHPSVDHETAGHRPRLGDAE